MPVTSIPLTVSYFIRDIAGALVTFNRIQWWRGRSGPDGLFELVTDFVAGPAVLTGADVGPHELFGKTLSFLVNDTDQVDVTFATADPVSTAAAAAEIDAASALITSADDGNGRVQITTVGTGTGASIEVLESEGGISMGFQTGDFAIGIGTDTTLVGGTHEYFFTDQNSDADFWYKVKLRHDSTLVESELTTAFPANLSQGVPKSETIVAYMRLVDLSGCPIEGRKVTLANTFLPNVVNTTVPDQSAGVFRGFTEKVTDSNGYVEFRVLKGIEIDVSVEATSFVRRLTIPSTVGLDLVDLLDPTLVTRDEFGIQEQNVDFAIRLS